MKYENETDLKSLQRYVTDDGATMSLSALNMPYSTFQKLPQRSGYYVLFLKGEIKYISHGKNIKKSVCMWAGKHWFDQVAWLPTEKHKLPERLLNKYGQWK